MAEYAKIVTIDQFNTIRKRKDLGVVGLTSGGFDPIHPGHMSSILESKHYCDTLVVVVNGDWFLTNKKGKPFQDLKTRCQIVSCTKGVDYVIPFEVENDNTVCYPLARIKPDLFLKGGDRNDISSLPEGKTCNTLHIKVLTQIGWDKHWSSSNFLRDWSDFCIKTHEDKQRGKGLA